MAAGYHDAAEPWAAAGSLWPYVVDTIEPPFQEPLERTLVFQRPRLLARRHRDALHHGGRRVARGSGSTGRSEQSTMAAAFASGLHQAAGIGRRREGMCVRARPRPDHAVARPERTTAKRADLLLTNASATRTLRRRAATTSLCGLGAATRPRAILQPRRAALGLVANLRRWPLRRNPGAPAFAMVRRSPGWRLTGPWTVPNSRKENGRPRRWSVKSGPAAIMVTTDRVERPCSGPPVGLPSSRTR